MEYMPRAEASSPQAATRRDLPIPGGPSMATTLPRPSTAAASARSSVPSSASRSSRLGSESMSLGKRRAVPAAQLYRWKLGVGFGGAPDAMGAFRHEYCCMSAAEHVQAQVELVLEPDGVRGVLRAQHTPDLPFSGWLGLAVAVDECRRSATNGSAAVDTG